MRRTARQSAIAIILLGGIAAWGIHQNSSADNPPLPARPQGGQFAQNQEAETDLQLRDFMRKKLAASNQILEGLCTDDMDLVKQGAEALGEISSAERWRVSNDVMYKQFSSDFREIIQQLQRAADGDNPDRVALKWMDATMSCLDCHRFVRGMRLAEGEQK